MTWYMKGLWRESCSCRMTCPCNLGKAQADQGWCGAVFAIEIQEGKADNIDLQGCKVVWACDFPRDFVSGNGTSRLYIEQSATHKQREELEAIFMGTRGGAWEILSVVVTKWLPTKYLRIQTEGGDNPRVTVGDVGKLTLQALKDADGRQAILTNPTLLTPFGIDELLICRGEGSEWADPDMHSWISGGHGGIVNFSLKSEPVRKTA
ncbi:MAG: DUF1326 domain-containing protein [Burkholderiales bacterium]